MREVQLPGHVDGDVGHTAESAYSAPSLLASIAVSKYQQHLPLYRLNGVSAQWWMQSATSTWCPSPRANQRHRDSTSTLSRLAPEPSVTSAQIQRGIKSEVLKGEARNLPGSGGHCPRPHATICSETRSLRPPRLRLLFHHSSVASTR
jgi:hypothetical protein